MPKAPIAVAIIARNSAKTIGACLDSIVPHVEHVLVCVDESTTDDTAKVAFRHGAAVHTGLQVSNWHECPQHGRVQAQHFARARQESFARLRPEIPWRMWIDADDVVQGGEKLAGLIEMLAPEVAGVWLPYHYSRVGGGSGPTATLFDRERIVKVSEGWQWQHRVHEVLAPINRPAEAVTWTRTESIAIVHQGEGHDTAGSARRNILLLEIDLEEDPNDMRALFYLGNQFFALSNWEAAIHYYERATTANNPYQVWQTYLYLSMAYEQVKDLQMAKEAAYRAMDQAPFHPEPYLRLAAVDGLLRGDVSRCEFWTKLGRSMQDPPFFAFKNPLDKTFNSYVTLGNAYANAGMIGKARAEYERAVQIVPTPVVQDSIAQFKTLEDESQQAEAVATTLSLLDGAATSVPVPSNLWKFGRVRDVMVPKLLAARPNTQPRIIFWCGQSVEPWAPPSMNTTGIGGSETAVIEIARRFARDGWRVDVYNNPDRYEGEYEEVGYWSCNRLREGERADLFVGWRNPTTAGVPVDRKVSLLWCHDLNQGAAAATPLAASGWDMVLGVSQWHADYLSQVYGLKNTDFVPNGIDPARFAEGGPKVPFRCVYASSPDRGLDTLLQLWPRIVEQEPSAELHVAYGWETMDRYIAMGAEQLVPFKAHIQDLLARTPGVVWRGRLPQDELAKLYSESYALLYPSSFLEVSCIVAMEAMAAGCVVVASGAGALPETVGQGGLIVSGNVYTRAWRDYYTHVARGVLHSPEVRIQYVQAGKSRAEWLTWDKSFEKWKEVTTILLEGKRAVREAVCVS